MPPTEARAVLGMGSGYRDHHRLSIMCYVPLFCFVNNVLCPYCATWHPGPKHLVYILGFTPEVPLMIRNHFLEEKFRQGRLDAKTLDNLFRRRIEPGANCPPFVSQAILNTVKEIYPLDHDA